MEDNPADVALFREALEQYQIKCELVVIGDGENALGFLEQVDALARPCPKVVVLDLNLPKASGFDVLRRVRASRNCGRVPVVFLSSSDTVKDRREAAHLGAAHYIRKSLNVDDFMNIGGILKDLL